MNPWKGLKGLPHSLWLLCLSTLVNRLGTMVIFFLALYLVQARGWTASEAATALAVYGAGSMAAGPFSGSLADRLGHRRTLTWSLVLSGALMVALPHVQPRGAFLGLVGLWSALNQAYWPASMALLADLAPEGKRQQGFVLHRMAANLGLAIGPALGGILAKHTYTALFWVDGLTTLLGALVLVLGVPEGPRPTPSPGSTRPAWRDPRLTLLLLAMLPAVMVFNQLMGALPLWISQDLGHGPRMFGLVFTLNTLLILLFEAAVNHRTTRWTHGAQLGLGALLIALGFGTTGWATGLPFLAITVALWTFGEMVLLPATSETVAVLAPASQRGEYMGLYSFAWTVALTLGPWLGLKARPHLVPSLFWGLCGLVATASALAMVFVCRRTVDVRRPNPSPGP